ncbi:hypothetical protein Pmani_037381 [Petrolisthes manimaculis]|uniref:Uncharacterized protein n=1 Tax=Petrolisthes manimaculis TaxID=1843537 RepID=A0AAE1NGX0_9EUCA|nr:hypothetical protein Pmani_037381 [Petrolisthes manimaculis]
MTSDLVDRCVSVGTRVARVWWRNAYATMQVATMDNNDDLLILFGGWTHPSLYPLHQQWVLFSELHIYNIMDNRWTQLYYPGSPPPTAGHTATTHGDVMVVFGGLQKQGGTSTSTNNLYCLDLKNQCWYKPSMSTTLPQPRYGHSQMKLDSHHILIMAGCGGSNKPYNDVWLLTIPTNIHHTKAVWTWKQVTIKDPSNQPPHMWYTPCCKVGNTVVVLSTLGNTAAMSQLLVPPSVRRQPWIPPQQQQQQPQQQQQRVFEPNVNGHRATTTATGRSGQHREYYASGGTIPP